MNKLITIYLISISLITISQDIDNYDLIENNYKKCNTTYLVNKEISEDPEYALNREKIIEQDKEWLSQNNMVEKSTITIPIVIHVIHRNTHQNIGTGTNISNEKIEDAIRILNEDYSKTNSEFPNPPRNTFVNSAGNANLEFCLATIDENGNPTSGVTRTMTTKTNFDPDTESNDMKSTSTGGNDGWDPSRYLNIWICDLAVSASGGMTLGYAYLPGLPSWQAWKDGLVVDYQFFGTIQGSVGDGRTATHEIGHYLGLNHTFAEASGWFGSCVDAQGNLQCCDNDDSNVDDTPATDGIFWGTVTSFTNNNSCNDLQYGFSSDLLDMDENFMSYAQNTWMFTNSQVSAMNATLNGYRLSLKNSNVSMNCTGTIGTGINDRIERNLIHIYPNPSTGKIIIDNSTNYRIENIVVRNILSEIVMTNNNQQINSIDLSNLDDGAYFIELYTSKGIVNKKIILSK